MWVDWDKRAILSLFMLIVNMGCYNFYFYELFWGSWDKVIAKALYYATTFVFYEYFITNDIVKRNTHLNFQICYIGKNGIAVNFLLFALILFGIASHPILYVLLLNGSVFAISVMILFSGIRHGFFKR